MHQLKHQNIARRLRFLGAYLANIVTLSDAQPTVNIKESDIVCRYHRDGMSKMSFGDQPCVGKSSFRKYLCTIQIFPKG